MRADRLLSLLMLLQSRGRLTARELSKELEVSERTIYRDIDALSAAGVPVYGESGREGGFALLDSYRTSLTGLTEGEVRALFMLSIPEPLVELGVSQELRLAMLKLSASLPDARREVEEQVRGRFYLDTTWWRLGVEPAPHLHTIYQSVWQDHRLAIRYRPIFSVEIEQVLDPYGLVAKAGVWHMVCARDGKFRVLRVAELIDVKLTSESFIRPAGFDLEAFWKAWCTRRAQEQAVYPVTIRVSPSTLPFLSMSFGEGIRAKISQAGQPDERGWITLNLSFESLENARDRLLGLGRGVEVLTPRALRRSILDYAGQIVALYTGEAP